MHITDAQNKYKQYMNLISALLKQNKQSYFSNFSQGNIKTLKNNAKGIKSIISLKCPSYASPNDIIDNNDKLTDVSGIANAFNKYFFTIEIDL